MVVIETPSSSQTCPGEGACITQWATPCRATQDGWVIGKSSDKMWSPGGGGGKPLQYSCHENLMNSTKRQKDMTPEDEPSELEGVQYATGKSRGQLLIAPERMKHLDQSENDAQLWMCLVVKVESNAVKNDIAEEPGRLGPWIKVWLIGKDPDAGKDWRQQEKGVVEYEMVRLASLTQWTWIWANAEK